MTRGAVPRRAVWQEALRDSDLDRTAKLVGFVISTYADTATLAAWPAKATIAVGAELGAGRRAVDTAVDRLEEAGFFAITRSRGRTSFIYRLTLPTSHPLATFVNGNVAPSDAQRRTNALPTSHPLATFVNGNVAPSDAQRRTNALPTSHPLATEPVEPVEPERGRLGGVALVMDHCMVCDRVEPLLDVSGQLLCELCRAPSGRTQDFVWNDVVEGAA